MITPVVISFWQRLRSSGMSLHSATIAGVLRLTHLSIQEYFEKYHFGEAEGRTCFSILQFGEEGHPLFQDQDAEMSISLTPSSPSHFTCKAAKRVQRLKIVSIHFSVFLARLTNIFWPGMDLHKG
jgi:hypothetical protein